ncbi:MAG: SBBP repeat-containing protein [Bacteroidetes bacterium]|nr:SBBP repeat-containing protein [Bacteroidota bacterium]
MNTNKKLFLCLVVIVFGGSIIQGLYAQSLPKITDDMISTLLGGSGNDGSYYTGSNVAQDSNGDIIIAGSTISSNFPTTSGVVSQSRGGGVDLFVAKLSADLSTLIASTYIGGTGNEEARAIEIDGDGNIYLSGITESNNFPVTGGAYDESYSGSSAAGPYGSGDVFVMKLSNDLSTILASTYVGGTNHECCADLAIAPDGNIAIAGATASGDFVVSVGAYATTLNTGGFFKVDCFITVLDANLSNLIGSTFIGGAQDEFIEAIEFNSLGELVVAGWTSSTNYPTTDGAYDKSFNFGTYDGFVSKFSADLTTLVSSTYIGGSNGWDFCYALTIDSDDNIFIGGHTGASNYPTTTGAAYENYAGTEGNNVGDDAFIAKFAPDLSQLTASSFLGGGAWDCAYGLSAASNGDIFIGGTTSSNNFPTSNGVVSNTYSGGTKYAGDVFVSCFSNDLTTVHSSTYVGDSGDDDFGQVLVTNEGIYVIGATKSVNFPVSFNAYDKEHNGSNDIFIIKMDEDFSPVSSMGEPELDRDFRLMNNYPNPFNPSTLISFSLEKSSHVKLDVFNSLGEHIVNLIDNDLNAGDHTSNWNGKSSSREMANSGIYFYRLTSGNYSEVRKMVLQK